MSTQTQYGNALFLDGFQAGCSAKALKRVHFSKTPSESSAYDEAWLQRLIMSQPSLLPVDQIEPAFAGLVPICIELPTTSGSLDNLLVTPSGDIALIECKLWRNPQARREVIGQIIDYAKDLSCWTYEKLQEAICRTKPLDAVDVKNSRSLYASVSVSSEIDEASFIDAVSRNLRRGRFLLLIVGDGIREGVESMTDFLQQYAGLHFTLGIVELALFEVPTGGYIAQPRVLARTTNIDRGIVTVDIDGRVSIKPSDMAPLTVIATATATRMTITKERYLENLEGQFPGISQRLIRFIDKLASYDVVPEFGVDSMILRWPDETKNWNLGMIGSAGWVFTDNLSSQAHNPDRVDILMKYLEQLASLVPGASVKPSKKETAWGVALHGKSVTVDALLADDARTDGWVHAIAEFQAAVMRAPNED